FVHIIGLTIGLLATSLLILYVDYEYSYDKHHQKSSQIYRLTHTRVIDGEPTYTKASVFPELGIELENAITSIESSARLFPVAAEFHPIFTFENELGKPSNFTEKDIYLSDSTFLKIFDFKWIGSSNNDALSKPNQIIVSKSLALRVFGKTDVVGNQLNWRGMGTWQISGVFEDWPPTSHLHFDMLASWVPVYGKQSLHRWDGFYTYILTTPLDNLEELKQEVKLFSKQYLASHNEQFNVSSDIGIQPLIDIHLSSNLNNEFELNGNREIVHGLFIMSIAILLIAVFNYINLATSAVSQRSKEVGVRKIVGSKTKEIRAQFLIESFCLVLFSHLLCLLLLQLIVPAFNQKMGVEIDLYKWLSTPQFWSAFLGSTVLITLLTGSYPALLMSRIKAINLIAKITSQNRKKTSLRSVLMTTQLAMAILFSMLAIVAYFQVDFITNKSLGYNKEILVVKSMELITDNNDSTFVNRIESLKNELSDFNDIGNATLTSHIPG
ncbi:ABC transporter permease, partial [Fulvivirga sp. RKSG066]|uniref:ABC transporter permease n=1 Tax=Fulvivirga aurantia TaxID=2529383 RepID=UPI0012BD0BA8